MVLAAFQVASRNAREISWWRADLVFHRSVPFFLDRVHTSWGLGVFFPHVYLDELDPPRRKKAWTLWTHGGGDTRQTHTDRDRHDAAFNPSLSLARSLSEIWAARSTRTLLSLLLPTSTGSSIYLIYQLKKSQSKCSAKGPIGRLSTVHVHWRVAVSRWCPSTRPWLDRERNPTDRRCFAVAAWSPAATMSSLAPHQFIPRTSGSEARSLDWSSRSRPDGDCSRRKRREAYFVFIRFVRCWQEGPAASHSS